MWFFAHVGITTGIALAADRVRLGRTPPLLAPRGGSQADPQPVLIGDHARAQRPGHKTISWRQLFEELDYRVVLLGSILPDFDKFVGLALFRTFDRSIFHTLLSVPGVLWAGFLGFRRFGDTRGLQLACCWILHLVLDRIWSNPALILWPFKGVDPVGSQIGLSDIGGEMVSSLTSDWRKSVPELLGLVTLLSFVGWLMQRRQLTGFLKTGRVR